MRKIEYLKQACLAHAWKNLTWRLSIFAVVQFPDKVTPAPYDLTYLGGMPHYCSPDDGGWVLIEDGAKMEPLFETNDVLDLNAGDYPGVDGPSITTTVGYYVLNWVVLYYAFEGRIPYFNLEHGDNPMALEAEIYNRCLPDGDVFESLSEEEQASVITPEMVGRFVQGLHEIAPIAQVISPTGTLRSLSAHPDADKILKALLLKHKDELKDPSVIVEIEKAMDALDKEWLSGDRSYEFYSSKKARMRRRKLFYTYGIEGAFHEAGDYTLIPDPLMAASVDLDELVAMYNSVREGSYLRGAETAKGGELVRIIFMIFQNHKIVPGDCNTKLRSVRLLTEENVSTYYNLNIDDNGKLVRLTKDNKANYLNRRVAFRRAFLCNMAHVDTCSACAGGAKADESRAPAADVATGGSNIMLSSMGAMHGKDTAVARFDPLVHIT